MTEERKVVSESRETTFDVDVTGLAALEPILARLVSELCATLERQGRRGRTIGIKVRLDDFSTHTRARTLGEPIQTADQVGPVALELLRRFDPARPVRLLGVRVAGLEAPAADHQLTLASDPAAASPEPSVERGGELAPGLARERMLDAELIQDPDHDAADVVLGTVGRGQRSDQARRAPRSGSPPSQAVKAAARLAYAGSASRRIRAASPSAAKLPGTSRRIARASSLSPRACSSRARRHRGVGARGLELDRAAQRGLVTGGDQPVGLGRQQRVQEAIDGHRRLDADELRGDRTVTERLHRGDPLDPVLAGEPGIGVDVDLGQLHLPVARGHGALEQRPQLPARAAPLGPEVDDDGNGAGAVENRGREAVLRDVHDLDGSHAARPVSGRAGAMR